MFSSYLVNVERSSSTSPVSAATDSPRIANGFPATGQWTNTTAAMMPTSRHAKNLCLEIAAVTTAPVALRKWVQVAPISRRLFFATPCLRSHVMILI